MDPKILNFLYLNSIVVLLVVIYLIWRPKRGPSRLNLRQSERRNKLKTYPENDEFAANSGSNPNSNSGVNSRRSSGKDSGADSQSRSGFTHRDYEDDFKNAPENTRRTERELNVIFQFNGHDFDAYEVLGVAAGSSLERVEQNYRALLAGTPDDGHELYRLAYEAIQRK